ncbi:MAG: hypothetical protein U0Z44_09220 [Kouleothrix sp.]
MCWRRCCLERIAARLAFRPDARDDLRAADRLLYAGRYYDARAAYAGAGRPSAGPGGDYWARLGIVSVVRGEVADHAFVRALAAGARAAPEAALIRLYQGQLAARAGHATSGWAVLVADRSALGAGAVSAGARGQAALAQADYAGAERGYRGALAGGLAAEWHTLAHMRLALLPRATRPARWPSWRWRRPLRLCRSTTTGWRRCCRARQTRSSWPGCCAPRPDQRAQLWARSTWAQGCTRWPRHSCGMPSTSTSRPAAAAYAAYTRWSAGDRAEGQRQRKQLVVRYPGEPRLHCWRWCCWLRATYQARAQLDMLQSLAPRAPDTLLAWGQWYTVQHDYAAAADAYMRARRVAPSGQRGDYALALARFYIDTEFQACAAGVPAAEEATQVQAQSPQAWAALAAARLGCGDAPGAQAAAVRALAIDAADAEAAYYLGRALAALGDAAGARQALVQAADAAPASVWRERAERQLALLGF